jgi:hypothetical protein
MRHILLLGLIGFSITAKGGLDLSPAPSQFDGQGITYTELLFKDDKRQVKYVPPQNWTYRGSSAQLHLGPPQSFVRADAVVDTVPLVAPQPLDEKAIEVLRQQFLSTLPPGAQSVKILSEENGPLLLGGNIPTYEFTASYQIMGETFARGTLIANLPDTQLRFKLTALKKDFDILHRMFRSSLISWQWIEPASGAILAQKNSAPASASRE